MKEILPYIYQLKTTGANSFLIDHEELTLIDTGSKGNTPLIIKSIGQLGKRAEDLTHVIVTHLHPDHAGSLAAIQKATAAKVYMHELDAAWVAEGKSMRNKVVVSPGLLFAFIYRFFVKNAPKQIEPAQVDQFVKEGDYLDLGAGFQVVHLPGHSAGQIGLLYQAQGGVFFAADSLTNVLGLHMSHAYEDLPQGLEDIKQIRTLTFQHILFGHGKSLLHRAKQVYEQKFGPESLFWERFSHLV